VPRSTYCFRHTHTPPMKPEQAITQQQPEIAPVIEHGFGMG
jgi:hypothetical protein